MSFQPDLPFFGNDDGFQLWNKELAARRAEIERRLGIPLGVNVRLTLHDFAQPFTGFLEMVAGTSEQDPRLRLRNLAFDFSIDEITALTRLD